MHKDEPIGMRNETRFRPSKKMQICRGAENFGQDSQLFRRSRGSIKRPSTTHSLVSSLADHTPHLHHKAANDPAVSAAHKQ
jgi:hypothetical protein